MAAAEVQLGPSREGTAVAQKPGAGALAPHTTVKGTSSHQNAPEVKIEGRISPHNIDAEQGLLASCLLDNGLDVLTECLAAGLVPRAFYRPAHQLIFEGLLALHATGVPPEEIVLANKLQEMGQLEAIGGHAYLYEITGRIQTTVHAKHWLKIVREKHLLREVIRTSQWAVEQAHGCEMGDVEELLGRVEASFMGIQQVQADTLKSALHWKEQVMDNVAKMLNRQGETSGVPSGLTDLDRLTLGFQPADLVVLGARPSGGKSAFAGQLAEHAVLPLPRETRSPTPTLIFSLEMTGRDFLHRMVCSRARADMQQLRNGFCSRQAELTVAAKEIGDAPLWIDDKGEMTVSEMRAKARRMKNKHGIGMIIVDYLQRVPPVREPGKSREQEVAEISTGLKNMAKELSIPVVALCQLNRESEREKRHPRLSDIRESGGAEADADVVLFLSAEKPGEEDPDAEMPVKSLLLAKHRNGPVGAMRMVFNRRLTRFENYHGPRVS